jgi:hypothetical protein
MISSKHVNRMSKPELQLSGPEPSLSKGDAADMRHGVGKRRHSRGIIYDLQLQLTRQLGEEDEGHCVGIGFDNRRR